MSQLERALKKARATAEPHANSAVRRVEAPIANAAFVPAWEFAHTDADVETSGPHALRADPSSIPLDRTVETAEPIQFRAFNPSIREKLAMGERARPEVREEFRKLAAALF